VLSAAPRRIEPGGAEWPKRLTHLQAAPSSLWVWGSPIPAGPAVAVVGSRRATPAGADIARCLGRDLAETGIPVISGMALGIDGAAHSGAIEGGGVTVAVLGCGIDVCYPSEHRPLRDAIVRQGCVISEEDRSALPLKFQFPKRNRIIAALAVAVVVVEGTARSGALSTARWAADLGREVLAVPGSIRSRQSEGTNLLVRDGARPYLGLGDLLEAVPELAAALPESGSVATAATHRPGLDPPLQEILTRMGHHPVHPDDIGTTLGLPAAVVAARLGALELAGAVTSLPGGLVARTW
jgi:DNA processing protein